ncbi:hypothetical protein BDW75DRAFT_250700 [Aspergillus navahoensis]
MTCQDLGLAEGIPYSSIPSLNYDIRCAVPLTNGTYCLPERCNIAVVESDTSAPILLQDDRYQNMTLVQFTAWNPDVDLKNLFAGDTVCVGPPATPSAPTATDTISNCGLYYMVQEGDICDDLTIRFGLTLSQLIAMSPSLDEACSNLLYTPPATTVAAPTATRTGTTELRYEWYVAASGDSCWLIYTSYGITFEQFRDWNAVIDEECSNIWPDYAYSVLGPEKWDCFMDELHVLS